jgi:heptosyltransferase-2
MPNNILVIRLSSLGDVILTAPVFRALKARWPDCRVSILVKPQFAAALRGNPWIDEVIPFTGLRPAVSRLRSSGFTHLLDLHANLRSFLLRRVSGIKEKSVYRKDAMARRLFVALGISTPALQKHTVERYLEALNAWGFNATDNTLSLGDYGRDDVDHKAPPASKVLIIQSAFLGDSLLTLPLARDVKSLWPACKLTVLTLEKTADLFRKSEWVDDVLIDEKRGRHGGFAGPWSLARELQKNGFDLALIPHRSFRSALLAKLSGIPRRVGFSSSAGRFLLTDAVPFTWLMHDLERNLALLKPLAPGLRARPDESVYLGHDEQQCALMSARLRAAGLKDGQRAVGVHPGSVWPTKRWLPERFSELCLRLKSEGFFPVLVGGPQDSGLCAAVAGKSGTLNLAGATDLNELKALMAHLVLFVTNDSGPMHLAAGCGVPTLAIFGATTRELGFFPYGASHRVVEVELACRPCRLHGGRVCPEGHFLCMKLITTDQVWQSAQEMLGLSAQKAPA